MMSASLPPLSQIPENPTKQPENPLLANGSHLETLPENGTHEPVIENKNARDVENRVKLEPREVPGNRIKLEPIEIPGPLTPLRSTKTVTLPEESEYAESSARGPQDSSRPVTSVSFTLSHSQLQNKKTPITAILKPCLVQR